MTALCIRIAGAVALVVALIFGWHELTGHYDKQGYERRAAEDEAAADQQAERNRDLQRQAELRYVVKRDAQDRFLVTTVKEIHEAAAPLAACVVPPRVISVLNAASECASGDSPASCGPDGAVPETR